MDAIHILLVEDNEIDVMTTSNHEKDLEGTLSKNVAGYILKSDIADTIAGISDLVAKHFGSLP